MGIAEFFVGRAFASPVGSTHPAGYGPTLSARNPFAQNAPDRRTVIFLQTLGDVWTGFSSPERVALPDQADHFPAHVHQPQRGIRAFQVAIDQVPDGTLDIEHFGS